MAQERDAAGAGGRRRRTLLIWALAGACALALGLDWVVHRHAEVGVDGWTGFYAACGLLGSLILVAATWPVRRLLERPEDYYER